MGFTCRKSHPEPVFAVDEDVVGAAQLDSIDLCQQFFNTSIGMKLLNGASTDVGDDNRAIISHRQAVGLSTESTEKRLLTIWIDARHASASIRNPERAIGLRDDRFRTYQVMACVG